MPERTPSGSGESEGEPRARREESKVLREIRERPSDTVNLVGETAASDALASYKAIGPSEAESRNALGMSPVEPDRHRHASRKKPR